MKNPPWDQRIARVLVRPLVKTPVTPNQLTIFTLLIALPAGTWAALHEGRISDAIVRVTSHERPAHLNFVICFRDEVTAHNELVLAGVGAITPNSVLGRACLAYSTSNQT